MLKDIVGTFVQREDISDNAGILNLHYGMNPLYVIDTIYNANISSILYKANSNCINGKPVVLGTEMPWKTMDEALANFSMFNIVDDVEDAAKTHGADKCKSILNRKEHIEDIEKYINQASNKYFKYNEYQRDCFSVIEAVKGELFLLASQLNKEIDLKSLFDFQCASDTLYSLRSAEILIAPKSTEVKQLRKIKHLFMMINWLIKTNLCALCALYKKVAPQKEKTEEFDFEL